MLFLVRKDLLCDQNLQRMFTKVTVISFLNSDFKSLRESSDLVLNMLCQQLEIIVFHLKKSMK